MKNEYSRMTSEQVDRTIGGAEARELETRHNAISAEIDQIRDKKYSCTDVHEYDKLEARQWELEAEQKKLWGEFTKLRGDVGRMTGRAA